MIVRNNLRYLLLMLCLGISVAHLPEYCAECEQEVWEQVPCSDLPITSTEATPITTTPKEPLPETTPTVPTSTPYIYTNHIQPDRPTYDDNPTAVAFKKCYCECKLGCKEFCRKVAVSGPHQQLTQVSSTADNVPGGQLEYTHAHQRKFHPQQAAAIPKISIKETVPYPIPYGGNGAAVAASVAARNINVPNYTLEELTSMLNQAYDTKENYPKVASQLQPRELVEPPTLPAPRPVIPAQLPTLHLPPIMSPPPPPPPPPTQPPVYFSSILSAASAVPKVSNDVKVIAKAVATGGRAEAKAVRKTPYITEEKVVSSGPNVYETSTVYPQPVTDYINPPSITDSYPISPTEAYPIPPPEPVAKPYPNSDPNLSKPESSSSFDMAIDNYLKDFGYGNPVIGPYANY